MNNRIIIPAKLAFSNTKDIANYFRENNLESIINSPGVYFLKQKSTNKYYVGSTKNIWNRVFSKHFKGHSACIGRNCHMITKDNLDDFEVIILINSRNYNYLEMEKRYIKLLKTNYPEYGFNISDTGRGGFNVGNKVNEGKTWITNGKEVRFVNKNTEIPNGFYRGFKSLGHWFNNGEIEIRITENQQIPEGFKLGKIIGKQSITDFINDRKIFGFNLPEGYYPGRYKKSLSKELFELIGKPELHKRNELIDTIDELDLNISRDIFNKLKCSKVQILKRNLKNFYNIKLNIK